MKKDTKKSKAGFIVSAELIFIATILVIGLVVGWVKLRNAIVNELSDVADAVGSLEQTFTFDGLTLPNPDGPVPFAITQGSAYTDQQDTAGYPNAPSMGADLVLGLNLPEPPALPGDGNEDPQPLGGP